MKTQRLGLLRSIDKSWQPWQKSRLAKAKSEVSNFPFVFSIFIYFSKYAFIPLLIEGMLGYSQCLPHNTHDGQLDFGQLEELSLTLPSVSSSSC
jgi:hypothetical protein